MAHVVCLIADPARAPLDRRLVEEVARAIDTVPAWLAPDEACDLPVERGDPVSARATARRIVGDQPIDVGLVPRAHRKKRLLVSDMDSTMITVECIDELADLVGLKAEVAAVTRRAMEGELDFRQALEARVALLEGLPADVLDEVYRTRVDTMPGARTLVATMRALGAVTVLVSGGFEPIVEHVRYDLGFDRAQANCLEVRAGRLTGRVLEPIRDARSKLDILIDLRTGLGLAPEMTLAVGDGANDLPMLAAAGLGVAYHAHARVRELADVAIDHGDLTALLYLQGIARRDFVVGGR
jgi:phosphoserine phosphatase